MAISHLKVIENESDAQRITFAILGIKGSEFERIFWDRLPRHLDIFHPNISGSKLRIDNSSMAGLVEAFDSVVGEAQSIVSHTVNIDREIQAAVDAKNRDAVEQFKQAHKLSS